MARVGHGRRDNNYPEVNETSHLPMLNTTDIVQSSDNDYTLGAHAAYDGTKGKQQHPVSAAFPLWRRRHRNI